MTSITFVFFKKKILLILNRPSDGEYFEERLQIGDILLIASDGLFDNLYEDLIVQIVNNHHLVRLTSI